MTSVTLQIVPCPADLRPDALALVLREIAPSHRQELAVELTRPPAVKGGLAGGGLFVALRDQKLCGAAWGQIQPGNTAVLWPPQLEAGEGDEIAYSLARYVVAELDRTAISMAQVVLPSSESAAVPAIVAAGFAYLADLLYLAWEAEPVLPQILSASDVEFVVHDQAQEERLGELLERTYEGSQDCPALNGARRIADVIDGYRATGIFRERNWLLVRAESRDVGVLILADHAAAHHWELVYMGLVPKARGRGWGKQITHHAQRLAHQANVERIVLAVDASNKAALLMYRDAGFCAWDQRSIYVRFRAN